QRMAAEGFELLPGEHPIVPVMIGDAVRATRMADEMLERGVFVTAFSFPVVRRDHARIRVQLSAAHSQTDIAACVAAFVPPPPAGATSGAASRRPWRRGQGGAAGPEEPGTAGGCWPQETYPAPAAARNRAPHFPTTRPDALAPAAGAAASAPRPGPMPTPRA